MPAQSKANFCVRLLLLVAVFVCLFAGAQQGFAQETPYHYFYFDQPVALGLDTSQIVVKPRPSPAPQAKANGAMAAAPGQHLAALGFAANDLTTHPMRGWATLKTAGAGLAARSFVGGAAQVAAAQIEHLVGSAAADPALEFVSPVFRDALGGTLSITASLLLGFKSHIRHESRLEILAAIDGLVGVQQNGRRRDNLKLDLDLRNGFEVLRLANELAQLPEVAFAEPDAILTGHNTLLPDDPQFGSCWGLRNTGQSGGQSDFDMDAEEAWDLTTGDPGIIVVVIDNGIQQDHPDLSQIAGTDVTDESASNPNGGPYNQYDNHGTAVAGCISALINNTLGTVGVAPGVKVASVRTFKMVNSSQWTSQASWTVNAVNWAQSIGARVTCNSNGYGFTSAAIATAYQDTYDVGLVHFAAAGNSGAGSISYPASITVVNAVAASNRNAQRASFSQYGTGLDFIAPGESIVTTDRAGTPGYNTAAGTAGDYATVNGTSFATPYAAGVAALVLSYRPTMTSKQVEAALQASAVDMGPSGYDTGYGWGHLNAKGALDFVPCPVRGDFDGDGGSDLLFYNTTTGQRSIWLMDGTTLSTTALQPNASLTDEPRGTGDFDSDGQTDILIYNNSTGLRSIWFMNGTNFSASVTLAGASTIWQPYGTGDFNSDTKPDLIFYNTSNGQRSIWLMDGTNLISSNVLPGANTAWQPRGAGDFNNDGKDDLIFYNTSTGQRSIWLMNGLNFVQSVVQPGANTAWKLSGSGDYNGDGRPDLVFHNSSTGQRSIWLMAGTSFSSSVVQPGANTAWTIRNF